MIVAEPVEVNDIETADPVPVQWVNGGTDGGPAGGVLNGFYPNPGFAAPMATSGDLITAVAEITVDTAATVHAHVVAPTPHPAYDDMPSLRLLFENGLI